MGAGVILCLCFNVSDSLVRRRAAEGASLRQVIAETGAGTACRCCVAALAKVHAGGAAAAPACARAQAAPRRDAA
ncbi:BFD-like [2Fe-2S] binding domain protein [Anaeromyxobacter sp. PSR-1]|nr:BFD-like [2Fe-2S] binding domain protein [Anaeromyxobacter sp. PSR-1]